MKRLIDADKVIEQLEDEEERSCADFDKYAGEIGITEDDDWHFEGLKRAIEIIKEGELKGEMMNGLIEKDKQGNWKLKGVDWQQLTAAGKEIWEKLYGALAKLKDYEETGLQPDEVNELKEKNRWIPITEALPEPEKYVLLSFENFSLPDIGRYEKDEEGGAFYPGDEDTSYCTFGIIVNAWMPLPEPYRGEIE